MGGQLGKKDANSTLKVSNAIQGYIAGQSNHGQWRALGLTGTGHEKHNGRRKKRPDIPSG